MTKKLGSKKKAVKFLKFIKHNEYRITDQLNKQLAKISMLSLLLNSKAHRKALLKGLNRAYVIPNIPIGQLDLLMSTITANNYISFSDNEIPHRNSGNYKAFHIITHYKGYILPKVLMDNGSAFNVMPMTILSKLLVD